MLWPKINSYKEFDNEKKFLRLENSPPITFLMVRPLATLGKNQFSQSQLSHFLFMDLPYKAFQRNHPEMD